MSDSKTVKFKVKRQDEPTSQPYYDEFAVPLEEGMNVISLLMATRQYPQTTDGQATKPVSFECSCLEEVCGSCTMVINGKVRQACTALVEKLPQPITLEPMSKFPVQRDLLVDRSRMFDALKQVKAWIAVDGIYDLGEGPKVLPEIQEENYVLSRCMTCGCCLEACPQWTNDGGFIGAQAISQAVLFNSHPNGASLNSDRVQGLIDNGLADCGNAQECVKACPKEIPLTDSIAKANRQATLHAVNKWLNN